MEIQILDISDEDSIFRSLTSLRHHWFEPQDLIHKDVPLFLEPYDNELNTLEATNIVIEARNPGVLPTGSCVVGSVTNPADAPAARSAATIFSLQKGLKEREQERKEEGVGVGGGEGAQYKPVDGETRKQRRATAASGSGSGSGSGEQRQARAAGGLAGGASSGRRKQREERAATSSGRRERRQRQRLRAATAATTAAFASSDSGIGSGGSSGLALARSAQRLGSGERPGGAYLKRAAWEISEALGRGERAAWEISEALGPRLASPERLGERPSAFCNHWIPRTKERRFARVNTHCSSAIVSTIIR
ncbi:hypothetical protein C4D60_Mb09t01230 [Musa balbisiana]|uniref:Uncharacterized protein n=1 Tax=Musa balbisiana TaxID=52838 RepID=A0A4S8ID74_MUSBA|nr:hypothetical protein C4D60_Mb09t01230 [Musa balbisiana]